MQKWRRDERAQGLHSRIQARSGAVERTGRHSVVQVARELGVSDYSLYKWRKQARASGELAFPGNGKVALSAEQQENQRLKRELEQVTQERDILKKAVKFFAGESK